MMEAASLVSLLAVPGIVMVVQRSGLWPERWFKRAPMGCPFCLGVYTSAILGGLQGDFLSACAGVAVNTIVASVCPWAFRWAVIEVAAEETPKA